MASEFYCPHCYKQIRAHELLYFKPSCGEKLPPPTPTLLQKMGISSAPDSITCNKNNKAGCQKCDRRLLFRACPICKGSIPSGMEGTPIIIAVTGAPGAGKSSYVHTVTEQFRKLSEMFHWTLMQCDAGNGKNSLFMLRSNNSDKGRLVVLAEMAEDALTPNVMSALSGIIALVDPLQVESAREELQTFGNISLPAFAATEPQRLITRVARGAASLPLAITLSKLDVLVTSDASHIGRWFLKSDERLVCRDSASRGKLAKEELETINCEMESWIATAYPAILQAAKPLDKCRFFGCSTAAPSLRVEDPLLWILSSCKVPNI